jgi:uncharacterized protein
VVTVAEDEGVTQLSVEQCWEMLRANEFGRLAFRLVDEVHITPINYAVDHEALLFRTAEGNKLLSVAMGSEVAFEIDEYDEDSACSVVVRGKPRLLGEDEARTAEAVGECAQVQRGGDGSAARTGDSFG